MSNRHNKNLFFYNCWTCRFAVMKLLIVYILQGQQFYSTSPGPGGQQNVRLIAITPGTAAPVETPGQTTVPMPTVPTVQAYTPMQMVGQPVGQPVGHYQTVTGCQEELLAGSAYTQQQMPVMSAEGVTAVNGGGQVVQSYGQTYAAAQPQQYQLMQHPSTQQPHAAAAVVSASPTYSLNPVVSTASGTTYYTIPPSTPTPPPLLNQPPPPPIPPSTLPSYSFQQSHQPQQQHQHQHHQHQKQQQQPTAVAVQAAVPQSLPHQQQQQLGGPAPAPPATSQIYSVLHSPTAGSALTYPPAMCPTSNSSVKSWAVTGPTAILGHPQYRPPSPTSQQQQVTISYVAQPPPASPHQHPQPATQLVALSPAGGYPQHQLGTLIQLGATPTAPQTFQGQPFIYRPFTPLQGATTAVLRPRYPSQSQHSPQSQHKHK